MREIDTGWDWSPAALEELRASGTPHLVVTLSPLQQVAVLSLLAVDREINGRDDEMVRGLQPVLDALRVNLAGVPRAVGWVENWTCERCGCTNDVGCVRDDGQTCHWAAANLCSFCAEAPPEVVLELGA
jgi:hypothetical protein